MKQKIPQEKKNIVVLGAGFAGIRAALDLAGYLHNDPSYEIIIVDRKDYQTYHSALYEAATAMHGEVEAKKLKQTVAIPLPEVFGGTKVKIFKGYIDRINLVDGNVVTDSRIIPYGYLVCAMGSIADYYDIANLDKYGFTLKSLEDAIMIRNRVEDLVSKKDSGRIIIGGAGFAGTELAGELYNLLRHECQHHGKDLEKFKITVVDGSNGFLAGLSEKVSHLAGNRLSDMVETRFSSLVTEVGKDHVVLNMKDRLECDLLVWTGGVRSCRLPVDVDLGHDKKDRTPTTEFLNLKEFPRVFVAGDNLCFIDPLTKKPVPQTAQEAIRQGVTTAKNIYRSIKGRPLLPYHPGPVRFVIPVSGKFAIFYTPNLIISGLPGWVIRKLADLRYFLTVLPWSRALSYWILENRIFNKND